MHLELGVGADPVAFAFAFVFARLAVLHEQPRGGDWCRKGDAAAQT